MVVPVIGGVLIIVEVVIVILIEIIFAVVVGRVVRIVVILLPLGSPTAKIADGNDASCGTSCTIDLSAILHKKVVVRGVGLPVHRDGCADDYLGSASKTCTVDVPLAHPNDVRVSRSRTERAGDRKALSETGYARYSGYADKQVDSFLHKKRDWSCLESTPPTFGKVNGRYLLLKSLSAVPNAFCS